MATVSSSSFFLKPNPLNSLAHITFSSIQTPHLSNRRNFHNLSCFINKSTNFSGRIYVPKSSIFSVNCCSIIKTKQQQEQQYSFDSIDDESLSSSSSSGFDDDVVVADAIMGVLKSITKLAMVVVLLSTLVMICDPYNATAIAASGGRMGGSSFSSRSSSSRSSSSSWSSSTPSSSSWSFTSPSSSSSSSSSSSKKSSSASSPSHSWSSSLSSESYRATSPGSGYSPSSEPQHKLQSYTQKTKIVGATTPSGSQSSRSVPQHKRSYTQEYDETMAPTTSPGSGFLHSVPHHEPLIPFNWTLFVTMVPLTVLLAAVWYNATLYAGKTSVLKLQVGLLGSARSLQKDLNSIAEVADTSAPKGLSYILTETVLALLRHPDFCISGYSCTLKQSMDEVETRFNQLSIEERAKFDKETLVNVNNIKRKSTSSQRASESSNEYIVITILVAAEGEHKLPAIKSSSDLKEALQKLGSIQTSATMAVEVLWTPQDENDLLSERELLEDYPMLKPL